MSTSSTVVELRTLPVSAEGWCARLHAEDVTEAERRAFEAWVQASVDHRAEYELCELTFALSQGLSNNSVPAGFSAPSSRVWQRVDSSVLKTPKFLAAGIALLAVSTLLAWQYFSTRYTTATGEQKTISLADGSTVELNTATALTVDLEQTRRSVTLKHGEAFFNIARDPIRPFVVRAGASEIRVLGTRFNVRVEGGAALVTVLQGHVRVLPVDVEPSSGAASVPGGIDLFAGETARVAFERTLTKASLQDPARQTSWRERKIFFDRDPLFRVIAEVNRYSEVRFEIMDPEIGALTLSGVFRTGDTDSVAYALRESYGLTTERDGDRILVKKGS